MCDLCLWCSGRGDEVSAVRQEKSPLGKGDSTGDLHCWIAAQMSLGADKDSHRLFEVCPLHDRHWEFKLSFQSRQHLVCAMMAMAKHLQSE
jgi:hypothetical protein